MGIGIVNSSKKIPFSCIFPMLLHLILDYGYFFNYFPFFPAFGILIFFLIKKQISYSINLANICMIIQPSYRCSYSFGIAVNQRFRWLETFWLSSLKSVKYDRDFLSVKSSISFVIVLNSFMNNNHMLIVVILDIVYSFVKKLKEYCSFFS